MKADPTVSPDSPGRPSPTSPRDRRFPSDRWGLLCFAISGLLAVAIGFAYYEESVAHYLVRYYGYHLMFLTVVATGWAMVRLALGSGWIFRLRRTWLAPVLIAATATGYQYVHEPVQFKVIMDELILLGTSQSLHMDREVLLPIVANRYTGELTLTHGYLDKRPFFYSFLLSVVHDATGYRPANAFWLNGALCFVCFLLLFHAARQLGGRWAALLAVALLAGLPIYTHNVTSGHFEILNLVMILATLLAAVAYLRQPDSRRLTVLVGLTVLLAQTRYESALYVPAVAAVILLGWRKVRRPVLSLPAILAPLALLPVPLQFFLNINNPAFWQLAEKDNPVAFSLQYWSRNAGAAWEFFANFGPQQPNSILISVLGAAAMTLLTMFALLRPRPWWNQPWPAATAALAFSTILSLLVALSYHWGQLTDIAATRFCLPWHLFLILAVAAALRTCPRLLFPTGLFFFGYFLFFRLYELEALSIFAKGAPLVAVFIGFLLLTLWWRQHRRPFRPLLAGTAVAYAVFGSGPVASQHRYWERYYPAREVQMIRNFLARQKDKEIFFVSPSGLVAITHGFAGSVSFNLERHPEMLSIHFKHQSFRGIYSFQMLTIDETTGEETVEDRYNLGPAFTYETICQERFFPFLRLGRIVRITGMNPAHPLPPTALPRTGETGGAIETPSLPRHAAPEAHPSPDRAPPPPSDDKH